MTSQRSNLETYLLAVRARLRGLPDAEVSDILRELRSHVTECVRPTEEAETVAAVLERLGPPEALAELYRTESLLTRADRSGSPWHLLRGFARWATMSFAGFFAFLGLLTGYMLSASLFITALVKPFAPERAGLWWTGGEDLSLHLGLRADPPPASAEELLGWWIVPIGLLLGAATLVLTHRGARWCIRRFRRTSAEAAR